MDDRKRREYYFVKTLQRDIRDFPDGVIDAEHESPDILVHHANGVLGIEVTAIFASGEADTPPPQLLDGERDQCVRLAQSLAETYKLPPVMVDVYFHENVVVTKRDRTRL